MVVQQLFSGAEIKNTSAAEEATYVFWLFHSGSGLNNSTYRHGVEASGRSSTCFELTNLYVTGF